MSETINKFLLEIIDLYASEFHWGRNEILENVYFDEFFSQREMIDKRKRNHYLMMANIFLLPNMEDKARVDFLNSLAGTNIQSSLMDQPIETDFEAILRAKQEFEQL